MPVSLKFTIGETSLRYAQWQHTVVMLLEILIVAGRKVAFVLVLCWQTYGKWEMSPRQSCFSLAHTPSCKGCSSGLH